MSLKDRLDSQLLAHLIQSIADNVQFMAQLIHHIRNAFGIFQDLHTLRIWVVIHSKGALDCLCKLSVQMEKKLVTKISFNFL